MLSIYIFPQLLKESSTYIEKENKMIKMVCDI